MKKIIAFALLAGLCGGCKSMDWIYWFTPTPPPPPHPGVYGPHHPGPHHPAPGPHHPGPGPRPY